MERFDISEAEWAVINEQIQYLLNQGVDIKATPIVPGTNLVDGDYIRIADAFDAYVFGGEGGIPWVLVFGGICPITCVEYITDRLGPNGEGMPVIVEEPPQE